MILDFSECVQDGSRMLGAAVSKAHVERVISDGAGGGAEVFARGLDGRTGEHDTEGVVVVTEVASRRRDDSAL